MNKVEVSNILSDIATMMELQGENPFKTRAYNSAARTVENLDADIDELVSTGNIRNIKGIGEAISKQITEIVKTGTSSLYQELKSQIPEGLFEMMRIRGLGPKKISTLYQKIGIKSVGELEYACKENRLVELSGFGVKTQENILKNIDQLKKFAGQYLYGEAIHYGLEIEKAIKESSFTIRATLAGSLRRRKEICKDIDIVASSDKPSELINYFINLPFVESVIGAGETKASVILKSGINVDLRVVSDKQYPYTIHHFTGSKEHNTALRHRGKNMGIKINEYGLFDTEEKVIECKTEEEIFHALGLSYIPPELRENMGEIDASQEGKIPELVEFADINGSFHIHTTYSDGSATVAEMVEAAKKWGWNYLGVTDHSQSAFYARGLRPKEIDNQIQEIDNLNEKNPDFTIFKGIEVDILKDGSLDYPDEILKKFDFVIAAIHSGFKMTEQEATVRLVKAMENPYVTMLAHPTGRLLLAREGYPVNMKTVIKAARDNDVIIELNASPYRLDIDWRWCHYAREMRAKIAINTDAHNVADLANIEVGLGIARKGWLEARDVFNTLTREEVSKYLMERKRKKIN